MFAVGLLVTLPFLPLPLRPPAGIYQNDVRSVSVVIMPYEDGYIVQWWWCSKDVSYVGWLRRTNHGWVEAWCSSDGRQAGSLRWDFNERHGEAMAGSHRLQRVK